MRKSNLYVGLKNPMKSNVVWAFFLLLLMSMISVAQTTSVASLQEQEKLQIKLNLPEQDKLVAHQQVAINIEVLSAYPFSDNFSLSYLDIENTIVIQANDRTASISLSW